MCSCDIQILQHNKVAQLEKIISDQLKLFTSWSSKDQEVTLTTWKNKPELNMLKILPIIPSSTSQNN